MPSPLPDDPWPLPPALPPAPWWCAPQLRWLLAAPVIALVVVILVGQHLHRFSGYLMANVWTNWADEQVTEGDFDEALVDINKGLAWMPADPHLYYLRAQILAHQQDLPAALADYDRVIELAPNFAPAYSARGSLKRRLGLYHEAIADLTRAIQLRPADDPYPLNHRAYVRALAGVELPEALLDIERAIRLAGEPQAALLDTRGYLHYLLGNLSQAQTDMAQAIELTQQSEQDFVAAPGFKALSDAQQERLRRLFNENLAVMYHHRGLIHQRLGNDELAQQDLEQADQFGYDPFLGIE